MSCGKSSEWRSNSAPLKEGGKTDSLKVEDMRAVGAVAVETVEESAMGGEPTASDFWEDSSTMAN